MYYVYILKLSNGNYYHGLTQNLKTRLQQHARGEPRSTAGHLPVKLKCFLAFDQKEKAEKFESYLRTGSGYAFRNKRLL